MQRRFFLRQTTTGATAAAASSFAGVTSLFAEKSEGVPENSDPLIDTNVSVGAWPFSATPHPTPTALAKHLRENGVVQAWTGSFEALLHHDLDAVNDRLARIANQHSVFLPIGAVNPMQKSWKQTLNRCVKTHRMRGIRLQPGFHGYSLDHPEFAALLQTAAKNQLRVQIVVDHDSKNRPISDRVQFQQKLDLIKLIPHLEAGVDIQLLGITPKTAPRNVLAEIAEAGGYFESHSGLEKIDSQQLLFGSNSPLRSFPKLETEALDSQQIAAISSHNAENWMLQV